MIQSLTSTDRVWARTGAVLRWTVAFVALSLASLAGGCDTVQRLRGEVDTPEQAHVGMLVVVAPEECMIPEGCGPRNRLYDEEFENRVVAVGEVDAGDSGHVVRVDGKWVDGEAGQHVLEIHRYAVLSRFEYHAFLVEQADRFATQRFGCHVGWDKTFAWRVRGEVPYLIVRMTDVLAGTSPSPRIELWYDGVTGRRVEADLQLAGVDPCA